jgi:hypothetical protein
MMKTSALHREFQGRSRTALGFSSRISNCQFFTPEWRFVLAVAGCVCLLAQTGWATTCSYSITLPPGCFLIANHCDHVGGNTLNAAFPAVPNGSRINKWNCQAQSWEPTATFSNGMWVPNLMLDPGEGALFCNPGPAVTVTVSGDAHTPVLPLNLPANGCCMVSRQEPLAGGFDDIVGLPPQEGDVVYRLTSTGGFFLH